MAALDELILGVVAIAISVLSALWTGYSSWRQHEMEKKDALINTEEQINFMYKDAQKALGYLSIYARVPGDPDGFNLHLADFMKNPTFMSWSALCEMPPNATVGNARIINQEIRDVWLAIRDACQVAEGFWKIMFFKADNGQLPRDMVYTKKGPHGQPEIQTFMKAI